ncbi:MAG: TonB-dependent receptor plug domain-containing protein [Bacteroidales bacterium]|nr:TonB-dependent receptor plug domain-containing protein [Bacteroidales bacterium]
MERFKKGLLLLTALLWALPSLAQEPFNPATLLHGSTPSVLVSPITGSSGEDLSVVLRGGIGLRGDQQPLWIVDGVEINPSLTYLNIYDIADIKVLTDLSATAIYGNRGANGVILVTTGARKTDDNLRVRWKSDAGITLPQQSIDGTAPGFNHNHYLSLSGKTIRSEYEVSGWFRQTDGVEPHDNGTAGGLRTRFEMRAGSFLGFGMNTAFVMGENNRIASTESFGNSSLTLLQRNPDFFPGQTVEGWKEDYDNESQIKRLTSAVYISANFTNSFKARLNLGCDLSNTDRFLWYGSQTPFGQAHNGYATVEGNTDFGYNADFTLSWNYFFAGKHRVSVAAAADAHGLKQNHGSMSGDDFFTHTLRARGLNLYNGDPDIDKYSFNSFAYGGYFSAGYELDRIAGVNALLRADLNPRYDDEPCLYKNFDAWFDAGKAFFPGSKAISTLRLSASYGEAGRERSMPYIAYGDFLMGTYPDVTENIRMFYEGLWRLRGQELTAKLELGLLEDRIRLSALYFDRLSDDSFLGYCFGKKEGYYWERAPREEHFSRSAQTHARGIEGELKAIILKSDKMTWDVSAGAAYNISQICAISDDEMSFATANVLGYPAASFYGIKTDDNGNPIDVSGDGIVNRFDRQIIGNSLPQYYGSFATGFRYGRFSANLLGTWASGFDVLDLNKLLFEGGSDPQISDKYLCKGDYLRLSRARAAYSIPLNMKGVESVAVSVTGYDLLTLSESKRWNPVITGVDYGTCPASAAVLLGVSLTFGRK